MQPNMPADKFHTAFVSEVFRQRLNHEEVLCLMLLLHACRLRLSATARLAGGGTGFEGITTRHAAEVVASLFPSGDEADPDYWYGLWNGEWEAYAILENPERLTNTLQRIRDAIESHPWVAALEDEDWELLANK